MDFVYVGEISSSYFRMDMYSSSLSISFAIAVSLDDPSEEVCMISDSI